MKKYLFIFLFFSSLFSQTTPNQLPDRIKHDFKSRIELLVDRENNFREEELLLDYIESIMQTHLIPGLSISVVKDDNIVWEKYFGYSNIDEDILVDENTMFILSSISKTVTATALMQLFEDDLFMLDDDINDYLPFNVRHPNYQNIPITFKMLLSHTSGIQDNWNVMPYYDGDSGYDLGYYLQQYLLDGGDFYTSNLNFTSFEPGVNYSYSNIGVSLLGFLVEQISNQPFNDYCNQNIFEPLDMNNAFWFLSEIENLNQLALPYQISGGTGDSCFLIGCGIYDENNPCYCDPVCVDYGDCCFDYEEVCGENGTGSSSANLTQYDHYGYSDYPSGQLRTTSNNLAKFMSAYINGGVYNGVRILDSETIDLIKTIHYPIENSQQGLIWYYKSSNQRTLFGHNGGDLGSLTEMFVSLSDNLGVVLLSNSTNYNAVIEIENAVLTYAEQTNFSVNGDVNSDGIINILDVILVINNVLFSEEYNYLSDLNSDNIIDILDVVILVNIILS